MAHKKGGGTAKINRDSISKRRGVKLFAGQSAKSGNIIIRQKGNKFYPGKGVKQGSDFTIFAVTEGKIAVKKSQDKNIVEVI